ncbi:MAG: ADP-ribosylglycohydrolase family protein [Anaerolineae bacterium]|nr:ADP-ribosylglycohydrolase family protein [Anaerolineae bacterium]
MSLPVDYVERVYAGVLGKIIGVYLGRPFEGWSYERIVEELGEVWYYVHDRLNKPLIVTDDDISGTFTFLRALPDYGNDANLTPVQIGQTWLNYLIDRRTVLWWGGLGNSTEHTAYLRLKKGIPAPRSGSIALNGKVVAEQIGAQIFIDGWAMVAPGDPERAADLARRAASVSHDGEAIYGAQVLAAMESLAFVEADWDVLFDTALRLIPDDSVIHRMIGELRDLRAREPDWRTAFAWLRSHYGYNKYGGNCHLVPNHGLLMLSLLYGDDDFQKTLMLVNTCGWDTDCNSGNAGCLMGIKNGLVGLEMGPDWRGPVADRLYLPTADGGRAITDAVAETYHIVNVGRALAGQSSSAPKGGARFHFDLPGAVQGWLPEQSSESKGTLTVENVAGHSELGSRSLALRYCGMATGRPARVAAATFIPKDAAQMPGYGLLASPTLYPGQTVRARLVADESNVLPVVCRLFICTYGAQDALVRTYGPSTVLSAGEAHCFEWSVLSIDGAPSATGAPVAEIGIEINSDARADGTLYLDYLTWDGEPDLLLTRPVYEGTMWRCAWVDGVDQFSVHGEPFRLVQNEGTGLLMHGAREWQNYCVGADVTPHLVEAAGIAARAQGMRRYYALLLCRDGMLRLVKALDGDIILAEKPFAWQFGERHDLSLETVNVAGGVRLRAWIDGDLTFEVVDLVRPLLGGAVALLCTEGRTATQAVSVRPAM